MATIPDGVCRVYMYIHIERSFFSLALLLHLYCIYILLIIMGAYQADAMWLLNPCGCSILPQQMTHTSKAKFCSQSLIFFPINSSCVGPATLCLLLLSAQLFSGLCSCQEVDRKHSSIEKVSEIKTNMLT